MDDVPMHLFCTKRSKTKMIGTRREEKIYRKIFYFGDYCQILDDSQGFPCFVIDVEEGLDHTQQLIYLKRFNGEAWVELPRAYTRKDLRPLTLDEEKEAKKLILKVLWVSDNGKCRFVIKPGNEVKTYQTKIGDRMWQDTTFLEDENARGSDVLAQLVLSLHAQHANK